MGNGRRWTKVTPRSTRKALQRYASTLAATGMDEREVARAYFYAEEYGLNTLTNDNGGCMTFDEPNCDGSWDCLRPDHQVLVKH